MTGQPVALGVRGQVRLPTIGGGGGGQFEAACPAGENLAGVELRAADDVDAIAPVCVAFSGPTDHAQIHLTSGSGLVPIHGGEPLVPSFQVAPGWNGGPGGRIVPLLCPRDLPVVTGMDVAAEGVDTVVVNNIHLFCGRAVATQSPAAYPSAVFDGPSYTASQGWGGIGVGGEAAHGTSGSDRCPAGQVAVGVYGRSGVWLDAIGLICDAATVWRPPVQGPPASAFNPRDQYRNVGQARDPTRYPLSAPVASIGRGTQGAAAAQPLPICDAAATARARNSPAAPGLEAKCRAAGGPPPPPPPPPEPAPDPDQPPPDDGGQLPAP